MSFPLHFTCMLLFCCILFFDPNRIVFILPKCNDNLLSTNHLWIELSSTVNVVSISVTFLPDTINAVYKLRHRRTGEHPFGGSNRVLPEWRKQLVCHAAPPGRKNNNELLHCLFLTVVDRYPRRLYPMNVSFVTPPEMYLR